MGVDLGARMTPGRDMVAGRIEVGGEPHHGDLTDARFSYIPHAEYDHRPRSVSCMPSSTAGFPGRELGDPSAPAIVASTQAFRISRSASRRSACLVYLIAMEAVSPLDARNAQEFISLEAGAADQGAVNLGDAHQLLGVGGLHRPAVEDAHPLSRRPEARGQALPDETVHLGDVARRGSEPGAD